MIKFKEKKVWIVFTILMIFLFQQFISKIGAIVANIFNYDVIDKYNVFAWISVHHIIQMLLALVPITILTKKYNIDFGFQLGDKNIGIKYVKIFNIAMLVYITITSAISYLNNQITQFEYPLTYVNILGSLSFQLFLSGTSEEILFRALPISIITYFISSEKDIKIAKLNISWANIISAILFSLAHIKWTLNPFLISMDYMQLLFCFILGIMYGIVFQKSKSVIYPMIMHSFTNVSVIGVGYILSLIK